MHSHIITPPDFVDDELPTVTVIDASWDDIENIALWLQSTDARYNVYVYNDIMFEDEWLDQAVERSHVIIINSEESGCTKIKNRLLKDPRTWYYGPNRYLGNPNQLNHPIDYFIKSHE